MQAKLDALRPSLGPDGVHLTDQGRYHLFHGLAKTVLALREGKLGKPPKPAEAAASSLISGRTYYWRGFTSDRGSTSRPPTRGSNRGRGGASGSGTVNGRHPTANRNRLEAPPRYAATQARGGRRGEAVEEASSKHPLASHSNFEFVFTILLIITFKIRLNIRANLILIAFTVLIWNLVYLRISAFAA
jgi:hypothetical protein